MYTLFNPTFFSDITLMRSVDPPDLEPYENLDTYACDANADKTMLLYYVTTDVLVKQGLKLFAT